MAGILYLCATPIGNLGDVSYRVLETLKTVDVIAAEDTRNSIKLLNHFQIRTPMISYHEHNKAERGVQLLGQLQEGQDIALITDAGMPGISDPGELLVRMCREKGIAVTALPGPCACVTALALSGISTGRFCFEGFLPRVKKEKQAVLEELQDESRTIILYVAPHHLVGTLIELKEVLGNRRIALCRELTKKFEEVISTTFSDALVFYEGVKPRGEYVLVVEGKSLNEKRKEEIAVWSNMSIEAHMEYYEGQGMEHKEAMKKVAGDRGMMKREIYRKLHGE